MELESANGEVGWGEVAADAGPWYSYETIETAKHVIMDFIAPLIKGRKSPCNQCSIFLS